VVPGHRARPDIQPRGRWHRLRGMRSCGPPARHPPWCRVDCRHRRRVELRQGRCRRVGIDYRMRRAPRPDPLALCPQAAGMTARNRIASDRVRDNLLDVMGETVRGLMTEPDVTDIILNPPLPGEEHGRLWVSKLGNEREPAGFMSADQAMRLIGGDHDSPAPGWRSTCCSRPSDAGERTG